MTFEIVVPPGAPVFAIGAALYARRSFHLLIAQDPEDALSPAE